MSLLTEILDNIKQCAFCGARGFSDDVHFEEKEIIRQTVYGVKTEKLFFCADDNCAECYQMGCEG